MIKQKKYEEAIKIIVEVPNYEENAYLTHQYCVCQTYIDPDRAYQFMLKVISSSKTSPEFAEKLESSVILVIKSLSKKERYHEILTIAKRYLELVPSNGGVTSQYLEALIEQQNYLEALETIKNT